MLAVGVLGAAGLCGVAVLSMVYREYRQHIILVQLVPDQPALLASSHSQACPQTATKPGPLPTPKVSICRSPALCASRLTPSMRCSGLGRPHTRARSDHPVLGERFCQDPGRWPLKRIREL